MVIGERPQILFAMPADGASAEPGDRPWGPPSASRGPVVLPWRGARKNALVFPPLMRGGLARCRVVTP